MDFPVADFFTDPARTNAEAKQGQDDWLAATKQLPGGAAAGTLTLASDTVTPVAARHLVDTEGAASADDLQWLSVSDLPDGAVVALSCVDAGRVVTLRHGAGGSGQILLADGADLPLADPAMVVKFERRGTAWRELVRQRLPLPAPAGAAAPSGAGGLTLTAGSARHQAVARTAAGQTVALPDARLLGAGEPWSIRNTGWYAFAVADGAGGTLIATLNPGQRAVLVLEANGTAAGTWDVSLSGDQPGTLKATVAATPHGWVEAAGTIGDATSGATRAHADTWALFWTIWTNIANGEAPILDSGGSASTRGASAEADFGAHKRLPVPDVRGRVVVGLDTMAGAAASRIGAVLASGMGKTGGEERHTMTSGELAIHSHDQTVSSVGYSGTGGAEAVGHNTSLGPTTAGSLNTGTTGTSTPFNVLQPSYEARVIVKL